ncbi:RNA polymerase sigma factor [Paenibacillus sp. L3-i20]|uniref:RNA polymerase sigma factor n=1 Tax=Paenibacillus sp. L3-i20 TaxID=2905833 RepID=UPI001EE0D4E0|nr:sigma-70 family RNA polymerase sigma factor [Paenibacillus sp. L3-i20]GKU75887.1 hypothetical protein L3i20_v202840 [Paenibacillus sp. L3-i20]
MEESISEIELIELARQGDAGAFGQLIHLHRSKVLHWVERMTRDLCLSEDIVQDASIQAYLKLHSLTDSDRFVQWFRIIVINQVRMKMRRGGPNKRELLFSSWQSKNDSCRDDSDLATCLTLDLPSMFVIKDDPAEQLLQKEFLESVDEYVKCLNCKEREMFKARFLHQRTPEEIASDLNVSIKTVYTYLYRSKKKLNRMYNGVSIDKFSDG